MKALVLFIFCVVTLLGVARQGGHPPSPDVTVAEVGA